MHTTHTHIYIYHIYLHCIFGALGLYTTWLIRQYHGSMMGTSAFTSFPQRGSSSSLWCTILSQNMRMLFVSPETCWTDFAGMQIQGFPGNMADLPDLCWFSGGSHVCFYLNTSSPPAACYLLVSGPPQSLSPMLLKRGRRILTHTHIGLPFGCVWK